MTAADVDRQVRLSRITGHPLRVAILEVLEAGPASPNEVRLKLGEDLPSVSYHFGVLRALGAVELIRTVPVRGAVEHFYRREPGLVLPAVGLDLTPRQRAFLIMLCEGEALVWSPEDTEDAGAILAKLQSMTTKEES